MKNLPNHIFKKENHHTFANYRVKDLWYHSNPKNNWTYVGHSKPQPNTPLVKKDHDILIMVEHKTENTRVWFSKKATKTEAKIIELSGINEITEAEIKIYAELGCLDLIEDRSTDISRAYKLAQEKFQNILRKYSNTGYFEGHIIPVAKLVAENYDRFIKKETYPLKTNKAIAVTAALLHDIVEDTDITLKQITERFGETVSNLVAALTKQKSYTYSPGHTHTNLEEYHKFIQRVARNGPTAILIKLMDLKHNKSDLPPGPQKDKYSLATTYLIEKLTQSIQTMAQHSIRERIDRITYFGHDHLV